MPEFSHKSIMAKGIHSISSQILLVKKGIRTHEKQAALQNLHPVIKNDATQ